jgi:phosphoribosylformylglycinamidine cyclo-ligase
MSVRDEIPGLGRSIGEELLRPHRCYFNSVYPLLQDTDSIFAVAHITGGGLYDNIPRVLPADVRVTIERSAWTPLPIFQMIQAVANVPDVEMYRTFNMGVGMILIVEREDAPTIIQRLTEAGESAAVIGEVTAGPNDVQII